MKKIGIMWQINAVVLLMVSTFTLCGCTGSIGLHIKKKGLESEAESYTDVCSKCKYKEVYGDNHHKQDILALEKRVACIEEVLRDPIPSVLKAQKEKIEDHGGKIAILAREVGRVKEEARECDCKKLSALGEKGGPMFNAFTKGHTSEKYKYKMIIEETFKKVGQASRLFFQEGWDAFSAVLSYCDRCRLNRNRNRNEEN